jgi:Predicted permeases
MLRALDRYLLREMTQVWAAVTTVLFLIILSHRLIHLLRDAAHGELPGSVVFTLLGLKAVSYLSLLLPAAFFVAAMLTLGRLYRDNEMTALGACGVSPAHLYRPLLLLAVPLSGLVAVLSLYLSPWASAHFDERREQALLSLEVTNITPGQFNELRRGEGVFFMASLSADRKRLKDVFVYVQHANKLHVASAARGYQEVNQATGDRYLVLEDGYRYEGVPGSADWRIMRFARHGVLIQERRPTSIRIDQDALPTAHLLGSSVSRYVAELQWRLSAPLSTLLLAMLALPLSRTTPRQGRYGRLVAGILIYIIYANLTTLGKEWLEKGDVGAWPGLWWVHVLMLILILILLVRQSGTRWLYTSRHRLGRHR